MIFGLVKSFSLIWPHTAPFVAIGAQFPNARLMILICKKTYIKYELLILILS